MAYSVPLETEKLFKEGILDNPMIKHDLPEGCLEAASKITFEGSDSPSLPINWRFAESISSLKALEAAVLNVLLKKKYGIGPVEVKINTDHAQLFIMSSLLWTLDPDGAPLTASSTMTPEGYQKFTSLFPNRDMHQSLATPYRIAATNIYRTVDNKFFHLHGSLNPTPTLSFLNLPPHLPATTLDEAIAPIQSAITSLSLTASDLDALATTSRQPGTTCFTYAEYLATAHGQANASTGLYTITPHVFPNQTPTWWESTEKTSPRRPLAGLRVVDLTRIIAGPTIARGLAELGASIMRVTAAHLPDMVGLLPDLNWGKWNCEIDLRETQGRETLRGLIETADVVVLGYRPGVLDKFGFGEERILEICGDRERGLVLVEENCYGWKGEWLDRPGWQQISDACVGISWEFGRAMGRDEPITPVFPNSDYCTGVAGIVGVLTALIRRAEHGGSYVVKTALNYYNQWLASTCGTYPPEVWQELRTRFGHDFRHYHHMFHTLPRVVGGLRDDVEIAARLFQPRFFTDEQPKLMGKTMRIVAPVLQFPGGEVEPGYNVGTRPNGVDQPRWPEDLDTEFVV